MSERVQSFLADDDWDMVQEAPGFSWRRLRLGRRLGSELLGASVFDVPPGEKTFPYHLHHGNEELLLVLAGAVTVRAPDGEHTLGPGDAMAFRRGPDGAHQVRNSGPDNARLVVISTMIEPDVTQFPQTGKFGLFAGAAPGGQAEDAIQRFVRVEDVDYLEGE